MTVTQQSGLTRTECIEYLGGDFEGARMTDATGPEHEKQPSPEPRGAPRWAIVLGVVAAGALLALLIALHLSGAIGPGVH